MPMQNFKKIQFTFLSLLTFILITSCGGEKVESQRMNSPIEVDGSSGDWREYRQLYNEDWKTIYAIVNDDTSISFMIQFRDHQLARKINTRGFTIWFNSKGEEEKKWGIHYKDKNLIDKMLNDFADGKSMLNQKNRNSDFTKAVKLSGTFALVDKDQNILSENRQNGIYAEVLYDQGSYCFEYKIKFNTNKNNPDVFTIPQESDLKLGIEIAAVCEEFKEILQQKMAEKMKGGMRPGGGMRGGSKRGGGRSGDGMGGYPVGGRDNMMKDLDIQQIWFSVELAN
jgi:hypothetical protein